jgi:hypothetical protein
MTPHLPLISLSPRQRLRLQVVVGGRCEGCLENGDPGRLQVYGIPGSDVSPEKRILLLCSRCTRYPEFTADALKILDTWVERRPFRQRMLVRKILGYPPAPYIPPESDSLEDLYRMACTGWCLNGSG